MAEHLVDDVGLWRVERLGRMTDVLGGVEEPVTEGGVELAQLDQTWRRDVAEAGQRPQLRGDLVELGNPVDRQAEALLGGQVLRVGAQPVLVGQLAADLPPDGGLAVGVVDPWQRLTGAPGDGARGDGVAARPVVGIGEAGMVRPEMHLDAAILVVRHRGVELSLFEHGRASSWDDCWLGPTRQTRTPSRPRTEKTVLPHWATFVRANLSGVRKASDKMLTGRQRRGMRVAGTWPGYLESPPCLPRLLPRVSTRPPAVRAVVPERPALEGLEDKWAERWQADGTYAFVRPEAIQHRARAGVQHRHPAADGVGLAARRARVLLHPHRSDRPLSANARQAGVLPDRLGRQRPADRAPGAELLRRPLRPVRAVRPGLRAARPSPTRSGRCRSAAATSSNCATS